MGPVWVIGYRGEVTSQLVGFYHSYAHWRGQLHPQLVEWCSSNHLFRRAKISLLRMCFKRFDMGIISIYIVRGCKRMDSWISLSLSPPPSPRVQPMTEGFLDHLWSHLPIWGVHSLWAIPCSKAKLQCQHEHHAHKSPGPPETEIHARRNVQQGFGELHAHIGAAVL